MEVESWNGFMSDVFLTESQRKELQSIMQECVKMLGECDHKDHHGYCQTHFLQKDCVVDRAIKLLKEIND